MAGSLRNRARIPPFLCGSSLALSSVSRFSLTSPPSVFWEQPLLPREACLRLVLPTSLTEQECDKGVKGHRLASAVCGQACHRETFLKSLGGWLAHQSAQ